PTHKRPSGRACSRLRFHCFRSAILTRRFSRRVSSSANNVSITRWSRRPENNGSEAENKLALMAAYALDATVELNNRRLAWWPPLRERRKLVDNRGRSRTGVG